MISTTNVSPSGLGHYHGREESQEMPGHWYGKGAKSIRLEGEVKPGVLKMVAHGHAPNGLPLKLKRSKLVNGQYKNAHMAGTDAVFSPPKSASILGLVGGDKRIEEAHQLAAEKTLKVIERDCTIARVRTGGQKRKENTQNLIAAAFDHRESRPDDKGIPMPQIHRHTIIFGSTKCKDGKWRRLDNEQFYKHQKHRLRRIYIKDLGNQLSELGYGVKFTKDALHFEIEGITREQELAFSGRTQQIEDELGSKEGKTFKQWRIAKLKSRKNKIEIAHEKLQAEWDKIAKENGIDFDKIPGFKKTPERIPDSRRLEFELKASAVLSKIKSDLQKSVGNVHQQIDKGGKKLKATLRPIAKKSLEPLAKRVDKNTARHWRQSLDKLLQPKSEPGPKQTWRQANAEKEAEKFYCLIEPDESEYYDQDWALEFSRPKHIDRHHWKELVVESGIDPAIASATFRTVTGKEAEQLILHHKYDRIKRYGGTYTAKQKKALRKAYQHLKKGGLWCQGADDWGQLKPHTPRYIKDKPLKYESPLGIPAGMTLPQGPNLDWDKIKKDSSIAIGITEGGKKACSGATNGLPTIGIAGLTLGLDKTDLRGPMKDFEWEDRKVFIVLDKDPSKKLRTLQDASRELYKMGAVLEFYGADVELGTLPGKLTEKVGLDDFFVSGRTWDEIKRQSVDEFARTSPYLAKKWKQHNLKRVELGVKAKDLKAVTDKDKTRGSAKSKTTQQQLKQIQKEQDEGLER